MSSGGGRRRLRTLLISTNKLQPATESACEGIEQGEAIKVWKGLSWRTHTHARLFDQRSKRHRLAVFANERCVSGTLVVTVCQADNGTKQSQCEAEGKANASHELILTLNSLSVTGILVSKNASRKIAQH
jgi:hypothetical protein